VVLTPDPIVRPSPACRGEVFGGANRGSLNRIGALPITYTVTSNSRGPATPPAGPLGVPNPWVVHHDPWTAEASGGPLNVVASGWARAMVHLTSDWVGDQGPIRDRRGTDTLNMCSKPGEGALDLGFWLVPEGHRNLGSGP